MRFRLPTWNGRHSKTQQLTVRYLLLARQKAACSGINVHFLSNIAAARSRHKWYTMKGGVCISAGL